MGWIGSRYAAKSLYFATTLTDVDMLQRWNQHQKTLKESKRTTVIYGHNSGLGLQGHKYTKGLDTGCVNGGMLTAMVIEGGHSHHITKYTMAECPNARA